ncbi:hypothetical protein EVAR_47743_1 [Eumeta japonica]|uniref:Uncharacterized protein n=1 Tax=Eumeta variegata TaxID=151549 RepID=A0A4C1VTK6_EUMVA|nr:hypothetical protein EVAR_47743_1 [Eumeta japonica]
MKFRNCPLEMLTASTFACDNFTMYATMTCRRRRAWDSDFGFKLNCAFKKAGLFRVRNLGGIKAHASLETKKAVHLFAVHSRDNLCPQFVRVDLK